MKENKLNPELQEYIRQNIIPLYQNFDQAHQVDHATMVIQESLNLAQHYDVNINMVYAIAAFHDTGLKGERKIHHLLSGRIIREDKFLKNFFSAADIETMAQAAEDHRASSDHAPRSIYGCIVAEADRLIDADTIVRRSIQYGLTHYPEMSKEQHYREFMNHMKKKYAEGGYLKLWIPESHNAAHLNAFREILEDEQKSRGIFEYEWNICVKEAIP